MQSCQAGTGTTTSWSGFFFSSSITSAGIAELVLYNGERRNARRLCAQYPGPQRDGHVAGRFGGFHLVLREPALRANEDCNLFFTRSAFKKLLYAFRLFSFVGHNLEPGVLGHFK